MKITITTDEGVVLEIINGAEFGCSDQQIISGSPEQFEMKNLEGVVKHAVREEIAAMQKRGEP